MNDNSSKNSIGIIVLIVIICILIIVGIFGSNNTSTRSQSNYEKSLYNAYDKKKNGENLTKEEQRAWDDYKEWERKNY